MSWLKLEFQMATPYLETLLFLIKVEKVSYNGKRTTTL